MNRKFELENISKYRGEIFGISIIWIMFLHGTIMDKVSFKTSAPLIYLILGHGNVGVDIFLFLSGMGLYFSYTKNKDLSLYMSKRLSRVIIPYVLIAIPAYVYLDLIYRQMDVKRFFLEVTQIGFWLKGYHLTWYVPGILLCYIIYPYLYAYLFGEKKNTLIRVMAFVIIWYLITYGLFKAYPDGYKNFEIIMTRIPIFAVGSAMGKAIYEKKKISLFWPVLATIWVIACFLIIKLVKITLLQQRILYFTWGIALVLFFAVFFSVIKWKPLHQILKWFGEYSLELYLVHIILRDIFMKSKYYSSHVWAKWCIIMVVSVLLAVVYSKIGDCVRKWIRKE